MGSLVVNFTSYVRHSRGLHDNFVLHFLPILSFFLSFLIFGLLRLACRLLQSIFVSHCVGWRDVRRVACLFR